MKYAIVSEKGNHRALNEDHAAVFTNKQGETMCVLCDGMGGHDSGEIASKIVVESFGKEFEKIKVVTMSTDKIQSWFKKIIQNTIKKMKVVAKDEKSLAQMGTTVVVAIAAGYNTYICNIGDSRAYIYRKRKIEQITEDQNLRNMIIKSGVPIKKALAHPQGHALFSSVGPNKYSVDDFYWIRGWRKNICLTTDGIHDSISSDRMHEILCMPTEKITDKASLLIKEAMKNGSKDNLTTIILEREYYAKNF